MLQKFMSRRGSIARLLDKLAMSIHKKYENFNYDFHTNGESQVLEKIKNSTELSTILDVGANHGEWSLIASQLFDKAQIHSFEVLPATFETLKTNTQGKDNIHLHPVGLSDTQQTTKATVSKMSSGITTLVDSFSEEFHDSDVSYVEVNTITGDNFCKKENINIIDFLKVDVEGFEDKVMLGLEQMFTRKCIKIVQFEYGYINVKTHFLLYDFYNFFKKHNMVVGKIYPKYVDFRPYKYKDEDFIGPNYLAVHESMTDLIKTLSK